MLDEYTTDINYTPMNEEKVGISIKNVNASWTENSIKNTLHNVNVLIPDGKLYALVGPVGAGKSSFLQLILGELKAMQGQVEVGGSISYASQEPWLFPGTVRSNILFGQSYEKKKYQEVTKTCALLKDFEQLAQGDKTYVGDRGASLSGGQCARINLARAVYRSADIYLLDDPLSAVDTHVGKQLFDECINGYLKKKTRILVTHQVQYLKDADMILVLNNGRLQSQTSFKEFQKNHMNLLNGTSSDDADGKTTVENDPTNMSDVSILSKSNIDNEEEKEDEPQETEELMAKGNMKKSLFWSYFRNGGSIFLLLVFGLFAILAQIAASGTDYWVAFCTKQEEQKAKNETIGCPNFNLSTSDYRSYINNIFQYNNSLSAEFRNFNASQIKLDSSHYFDQYTALWIYGGFIIGCVTMVTLRNLLFLKICMNASRNLHNNMFSCLLKAPMSFFDNHPSGQILNRFSKDIGSVDEILPMTMSDSIQIFSVLVGILVQVVIINWWTIFPICIVGFLYWLIKNLYLSTAQDLKRLEGVTKSPVFSHINSSLSGLTTIRSCGAQEMVIREFDSHQDVHTGAFSLIISTSEAFGFWLDAISIGFITFVIYSFIVVNNENTSAGNVGLAVSQVLILCGMLQYGIRQTAETVAQMTSVERILQCTKLEKEGPFESDPDKKPPSTWPHKGKIKFDHVYLRYSNDSVLKDLHFMIDSGMKVGIVGRTGAGKSSLISALFNLAKLDGAIYLDEIDTKKVGLHDLRSKISIIPQEPVLFSATLRDNLDPFHKYDDDTLWTALEDVELKNAVTSLDQTVNQGGRNFSAGQRQLLCLARAIVQNNKVLVLDEATANVDPATDALIQKTIRTKFKDRTVLTIAHRLNTIIDSDRALVLDDGRAVEFDHPYILLKRNDTCFSKMVLETGMTMTEQLKKVAKEAFENNPHPHASTNTLNGHSAGDGTTQGSETLNIKIKH